MEFRDRFMRAIYYGMEGINHSLMNLPEGVNVIGEQNDVSDDEVDTVVHFLKACIDRKEYDVVRKVLKIDPWFGLCDCHGEISVCSYAVKNIEDFDELTSILDIINIDKFEGVFMEDSPVEIALWENNAKLIDYFNKRGFKNEYQLVCGWLKNFEDVDENYKPKEITLDEYKFTFEYVSELFLDILSEKLQDEVIYIEYCNNKGLCTHKEIFNSFEEAQIYIRILNGFLDEKLKHSLSENGWWMVYRKKNRGGHFEDSMICTLDSRGKRIITMELTEHFNTHYMFRHHELSRHIEQINVGEMFNEGREKRDYINFGMNAGAICYINLEPMREDMHVIFLGYKDNDVKEPCFLRRDIKGAFIIDSLAHSFMANQFSNNSVYHLLCEIEPSECGDEEMRRCAEVLKNNPDLVNDVMNFDFEILKRCSDRDILKDLILQKGGDSHEGKNNA